jgi:iron complex transport system permease protein
LVRNPLVSPDVIGINGGASLVAVGWIVSGRSLDLLPLAALLGALGAAAAVYLLSWRAGISPARLILVGIGIGTAVNAATIFITIRFPVDIVRPAIVWTMGSVYASSWRDVIVMTSALAVLTVAVLILAWSLRVLQLGDDLTRGLGLPLERTRLGLIVVGCGLAAVAVAIAGPIGFVALMAPHIARMIAGPVSGTVILFTGVIGALFLLGADVVANHLLPVSLPVGVVTAAVGAPYFLFLLYRSNIGTG